MQIPILTLAVLDFRNMVRGILPKKAVRYGIFGTLIFSALLLSILTVGIALTDPNASKNLTKINMLAGLLLNMTSAALVLVTFMSSQDVENPTQIKMSLLSPWIESYQIIPRIIALILIATIPFGIFIVPFLLPVLITHFFSGIYLILITIFSLVFSVILSNLTISVLVKFFGRHRGSKTASMMSILLASFVGLSFQKAFSLRISFESLNIFLISSILIIPILTFFSLKYYRMTLLNSKENLFSKEPNWGVYPWTQLFLRGKSLWIISSMLLGIFTTFFLMPNGKDFIWRSLAISLSSVLIAFVINDLILWDRDHSILWKIAPNRFNVMKQLVLSKFLPLFIITIICIFALGITFNKLNWAIATACLVPLQFGILNFRYGKLLTFILTSFSCIFIMYSPIFS